MGSNPVRIANVSRTFVIAFNRCQMRRPLPDGKFEMPLIPGVVCLAFSIELGFKALAAANGTELRGHELAKLFNKLPPDVQTKIVADVGVSRDVFDKEIGAVNDAFVEWRYVYEQDAMSLNLGFLQQLAGAVQCATNDIE